ncbi:MAG: YlxR family protein [Deltaproteobacteria bacterium]|nr:YlxR family protein [Deltaproteobacteria bacterium]
MKSKSKSEVVPLRTCLICRQRAEKKSLCRLVLVGAELYYDSRFRAPGRGYYICKKTECLDRFFVGKRRFGRLPVGAEALDPKSRTLLLSHSVVVCEFITS